MKAAPIKLIVGLGNPGEKYTKTRHNAGFLFLQKLLNQFAESSNLSPEKNVLGRTAKIVLGGHDVRLLAPDTFMNLSGNSVQAAISYYKLNVNEILVAHDELDLDPGVARLKLGGGHGGNNGIRDIALKTASSDFARLRIGIGHPGVGKDVASYVLKQANLADQDNIERAIDESLRVIENVVRGEFGLAMNDLHTRLAKPGK